MIYKRLNKNLNYLIIPNKNKNVVSIKFIFKYGYNNEYVGINNYTHLVEHIIAYYFNKKQCSIKEIKNLLSNKIFKTNAYTINNHMCIYIKCYQKDIKFFFNLMSRAVFDTCITNENLDMSKKNVIKELHQAEESNIIYDAIYKYVYKMDGFNTTSGIKDVKNINIKEVNNFFSYLLNKEKLIAISCNKNYINNNIKLIKKYFNKKIEKSKKNYDKKVIKYNMLNKTKVFKIYKPVNSVNVTILIPIKYNLYSKKYWELVILLDTIFNFEKGVMYEVLRNKEKLIYTILYNLNYYPDDYSIIEINTNIEIKKITLFIKKFYECLDNFKMDIDSFNNNKNILLFNNSYDSMNKLDSLLDYNIINIVNNNNISYKKSIKNLKLATINSSNSLLKEIRKKHHYIFLLNKQFKKRVHV